MVHGAVVYSFLCKNSSQFLSLFCQWAFGLVPVTNNASNTQLLAFGDHFCVFLWSMYPGVLGHRTYIGSVLLDSLNWFSKAVLPIYAPISKV